MLFESDIRIDVAILESQAYKKTIIEYSPESNAAKDYLELTKEILKKINKMAKKEFDMKKIQEMARPKYSGTINHNGPKYIPNAPKLSKPPIQTTIKVYKEDLLALKLIASKNILKIWPMA